MATVRVLAPGGKLVTAGVVIHGGPPVPPGAEHVEPDAAGYVRPAGLAVEDVLVEVTGTAVDPARPGG